MTPLPPRPRPMKKPKITDIWETLRPGTPPPTLSYKLPFLTQDKTNALFLRLLVKFVQLEQLKEVLITSPLFFASLFMTIIGYYMTLRTYYKDQVWTYGIRQQLPGVAHQLQQQDLATFQYVTAPTAVANARRLGTKIAESVGKESPLVQFLETPFLKRLDMYPNVALFELSPQWSALQGENYTTILPPDQWVFKVDHKTVRQKKNQLIRHFIRFQPRQRGITGQIPTLPYVIPVFSTTSPISPIEYQPKDLLRHIDCWTNQRLLFDFADEVPTRLSDAFGLNATDALMATHKRWQSKYMKALLATLRPAKTVNAGFSTMLYPSLQFQTTFSSKASWMYGIPFEASHAFAASRTLSTQLPSYMTEVQELNASVEPFTYTPNNEQEQLPIMGDFSPNELRDIDDNLSSRISPLQWGLHELFSKKVSSNGSQRFETSDPTLNEFPQDPLGLPATHSLFNLSWIGDFAGLKTNELSIHEPGKLPDPPQPPPGYDLYRSRRQTFLKKEEKGPLVDLVRKETDLLKYPAQPRDQIEALSDYTKALESYRTGKLAIEAAERAYAPIRRKVKDLSYFWLNRFPKVLAEHINKLPQSTTPENAHVGDLMSGSLDWFAHAPVYKEDWHWLMRFVGTRPYDEQFPLLHQEITADDTRKLLMVLFSSDFKDPKDFESGKLKNQLQTALDYFTCKVFNETGEEDLELKNYRTFYSLLKQKGFSDGPSFVTKETKTASGIRRYQKIALPYSFKLYNPPNRSSQSNLLNERAFYEPMLDWLEHVFHLKETDYQFKFPKGAEFHWALHAHNMAMHFQGNPQGFVRLIAPRLDKIDPYYYHLLVRRVEPGPFAFDMQLSPKRAQYFLDQLRMQTGDYLRQIEQANLKLYALSLPSVDKVVSATDLLNRFQAVSISRRVTNDICKLLLKEESIADIGQHRDDWLRPEPEMNGFLFPDTIQDQLRHQLKMSHARYKLNSKSLWEIFQTLTSVRPLEIFLPPGYRLFVSRTLPDFARPRPVDYRQVKIFPNYDVARQPLVLPSFEILKKYYADLDVSFLPEPPKPELLKPRVFKDRDGYSVTVPIGPYPNYFDYPTMLVRQKGEIPVSGLIRHWINAYYLGAQNWIKDMPRNFLGFRGFTRGDQASPFLSKIQRERVKQYTVSPYQKTLFTGPEIEARLPSQLEDWTIASVKKSNKFFDLAKEAFFTPVYALGKHEAQLEAYPNLTLPQLSLDEWHEIFKTALDRARITGELQLNLDIPPIQPVVYNRPSAFEGMINVDPLASEEKQRSQALAQILLLASEAKLGAYNAQDYLSPRALEAVHMSPYTGVQRNILPIFWHYSASQGVCLPTPGRPLYTWVKQRKLTNVSPTWESAEEFLKNQKAKRNLLKQLISAWKKKELLGVESEMQNYEPITIYSWFILTQFLCVPLVLKLAKWAEVLVIRDFYIDLLYRIHPFFQNDPYMETFLVKNLRDCLRETGEIPTNSFRVFKNLKRRFNDIVGIEPEVLCRSAEVALSLRNKGRGGPTSPKGVLLYGPPGNGKTFLVQAIAGEANVPLVALTTSELLDKRRHKSAVSALIEAFKLAKNSAPCILFIDEIDGLGMKRSSMLLQETEAPSPETNFWAFVRTVPPRRTESLITRGHLDKAYVEASNTNPFLAQKQMRERSLEGLIDRKRFNIETEDDFRSESPSYKPPSPRQLLSPTAAARVALVTAFLTIMDYLKPHHGIVVIGATNRISVLDPAIRRSGRLDIHIPMNAPAEERRVELMRYYISRLGLQETIPWDYMADRTRGYSIADLETMINNSAMHAVLKKELHTLESLEDSLEATARHRHIRANRVPYPIVKKVPAYDPLFFLRIAYYQASRAFVHNTLPGHPTLPFVQIQLEPFAPEEPIAKLIRRPYTLQDLENRLTGMLAGKAGEFLLLYGSPFENQDQVNERQLFESNLGVEEIGYAVDLAYAIVDQWLLIDDSVLPLRKTLNQNLQEGQNDEMFFEPGGDPGRPHFMRYNLEGESRSHSRSTKLHASMFDKKFRIYGNFTDTLRWFAETKAEMNLVTEHFLQWSRLFTPYPFKRNVWEPVEQYYARHPHFKVMEPAPKPSQDEKMNKVLVRPTFPDLAKIDRDYLMQAVIVKCFNKAVHVLGKHRTLIDRMSDHLLHKKKLRSFEIHTYIQAYTKELREIRPDSKVRTKHTKGDMPDLCTKPNTRLQIMNGRQYLVIDPSWGPASLKSHAKTIPTDVFAADKNSIIWGQNLITFDMWRRPNQELAYLLQSDTLLQDERLAYTERFAQIHSLCLQFFNKKGTEFDEQRNVDNQFVVDLLLSMAPSIKVYMDGLDERG
jgi:SpoVK/Ycf46/Vps4 family AAA+-type ATPase